MGKSQSKEIDLVRSELEEVLLFATKAGHRGAFALGERLADLEGALRAEHADEAADRARSEAVKEKLQDTNWRLNQKVAELRKQSSGVDTSSASPTQSQVSSGQAAGAKPPSKPSPSDLDPTTDLEHRAGVKAESQDPVDTIEQGAAPEGDRAPAQQLPDQALAPDRESTHKETNRDRVGELPTQDTGSPSQQGTRPAGCQPTSTVVESATNGAASHGSTEGESLQRPGGGSATQKCSACGRAGATSICSKCRSARYCSQLCQRGHWKHHKVQCVAVAPEPSAFSKPPPPKPQTQSRPRKGKAPPATQLSGKTASAQYWFEEAMKDVNGARAEGAIAKFETALTCEGRHAQGDAIVHSQLASLYLNARSDVSTARRHLAEACQLEPKSPDRHYNLALLLENNLQEHAAALQACRKAMTAARRHRPSWKGMSQAHYLMGRVLSAMGRGDEAQRELDAAAALAAAKDPVVPTLFRHEGGACLGHVAPLPLPASAAPGGKQLMVETLSLEPRVLRVRGFLSDEECARLREVSAPKMGPSATITGLGQVQRGGQQGGQVSDAAYRTSRNAWVHGHEEPVVAAALQPRLAALTRLPAAVLRNSELMQVVHYTAGGHYGEHHDAGSLNRRYATVLYYLNSCPAGGETVFPAAAVPAPAPGASRAAEYMGKDGGMRAAERGLVVPPEKGSAVLFYNFSADGVVDPRAAHAACRVHAGEKWLANHWLTIPDDYVPK